MKTQKHVAQTEETLIARARAGNADAFSELVRMHSQQVYGVSLRMLKNHEDAEDNLQLAVFHMAGTYRHQ